MTPERRIFIGDQKIEEFYWAGEMAVYVNNQLTDKTYEECITAAEEKFQRDFAKLVDQ